MTSDHTHVRSLLLEQLESRSLLAAGLLSLSGGHSEPHLHRHVASHSDSPFRGDRPADVRGPSLGQGSVNDLLHATPRPGDANSHQRDLIFRTDQQRNQRLVPVIRQINAAPTLEMQIIQRPVVVQLRTPPQATVSVIQPTLMITLETPTKSPVRLTSSVDTAIRQDDEFHAPDRSVGETQDQPAPESPSNPTSAEPRSVGAFTAADDNSKLDVSPIVSKDATDKHRIDPLSTQGLRSRSVSASIELEQPLSRRESPANDSSEDASWELDTKSIRRLRAIIDTPNTCPAGRFDGKIDQAITDWFGGPGGLVEILRDGSVLPMPESLNHAVEIPIDVIVGSHHRLEIASANHSSSRNHQIRDAVLAALAGEQAGQAAPLHGAAATRMDRFLYSGLVLAASTLAVANRRKQKKSWCNTTAGNQQSRPGR